jgi:hypothetical protein
MTPIQSSNSSANKIAANRLHFDYIFYLATVHRPFFGQVTRPSIRLRWLMDYSEILRSNIASRMLRTLVESVCKCG